MAPRFLLCPPTYFEIKYEINAHMRLEQKANHAAAQNAWERLVHLIKTCGGEPFFVTPEIGYPDMVFSANAGLVVGQQVILSQMTCDERAGEIPHFKHFFETHGYDVLPCETPHHFEGEAEAVLIDDRWYLAYGFRSEKAFYETHPFFSDQKKYFIELVDPNFYHFDTCFLSIGENRVIWYPNAFSEKSQALIREQPFSLFDVPHEEALSFACNSVRINDQIIMPEHCPKTAAYLTSIGFTTHHIDVTEFLKAGGACNCMVLSL